MPWETPTDLHRPANGTEDWLTESATASRPQRYLPKRTIHAQLPADVVLNSRPLNQMAGLYCLILSPSEVRAMIDAI